MNILITGANGFIGSNLYSLLKKNSEYTLFKGTRSTIDLYSRKNVYEYIKTNKIETIIHCSIEGGNRTDADSQSVVYNNLLMTQNLVSCPIEGRFINIASGAEFDRNIDIFNFNENRIYNTSPSDYYGLSKNIISKLVNNLHNGVNLRIFGCFYHNELDTRFIKANIIKYIKNQNMLIHQDKYMDFIYFEDFCNVVNYCILNKIKHTDINMSYLQKYKLSDIAKYINNLSEKKVQINIDNISPGSNYTGDGQKLAELNIEINGLFNGIDKCYDVLFYQYKN